MVSIDTMEFLDNNHISLVSTWLFKCQLDICGITSQNRLMPEALISGNNRGIICVYARYQKYCGSNCSSAYCWDCFSGQIRWGESKLTGIGNPSTPTKHHSRSGQQKWEKRSSSDTSVCLSVLRLSTNDKVTKIVSCWVCSLWPTKFQC